MPTPEEIASEQERLYESSSLRDDINDAEATVLLKWGETQVEQMAQTFPDDFEKKARFLRQLLKNINRFVGQREFNDKAGQRDYMAKVVKYLEPLGYTADEESLFAALPDDATDMMANLKAIIATLTPKASNPQSDDKPPTPTDEQVMPTIEDNGTESIAFDTIGNPTVPEKRKATDEQTMPAITDDTDDEEIEITNYRPNMDNTEIIPDISHLLEEEEQEAHHQEDSYHHNIHTTEDMPKVNYPTAEVDQVNDGETLENSNTRSINQTDTDDTTGTESNDVTTNK